MSGKTTLHSWTFCHFYLQDKYGGFVRPATVEVGDFPEEDLDFSDGEM